MAQKKEKRLSAGRVLVLLGVLLLLLGAAGLYGYNQWVDYQAGVESETAVLTLVEEIQSREVVIQEVSQAEEGPSEAQLKVAELDGAYYMGVLTIPSLGKILPIQSDWSMSQLKRSPCRYSGSIAEGELVIAGHNYKKHFSGLATLKQGDSIVFTDLEGNQIFYEVREIYTVAATDINGMVNSGYDLSLFTCNYGGKARVTVRCDRVEAVE